MVLGEQRAAGKGVNARGESAPDGWSSRMATLIRPDHRAAQPNGSLVRLVPISERALARANSTPGRYAAMMLVLVVLSLACGITGVVGVQQRSALVDGVRTGSGPLAVQALNVYRSLSDADATAASAFLSVGAEPAELRQRYADDIAAAGAALAAAGASGAADEAAVGEIAVQLSVYTGLVETARAYNRQRLPLGAAYLREASGLMRERLLPAAQELYESASRNLSTDRDTAAGAPWWFLLFGVLTLAAMAYVQVQVRRRTNRTLNVGLAVATGAALIAVLWLTVAWSGVHRDLEASRVDGSAQMQTLVRARTAALQARADEALTLIARGNGKAFEEDYERQMAALAGREGFEGLLGRAQDAATDSLVRDSVEAAIESASKWRNAHTRVRSLDDGGQYGEAVKLAIGNTPSSAAEGFTDVDANLTVAIDATREEFEQRVDEADRALTAATGGMVVLTLVMVAGIGVGLQQRVAEYR